ncbi:MAG TPA: dTDP-4-dehydrorhamnose reductase, partial [Steroidobacteraceae bacterium]|nr:dTDP-4-dehydrorhamnose reductase [Steroidobacteraceae bacterium]
MRVLITGASGQVGRALQASKPADVDICALSHEELDIVDPAEVRQAVTAFAPAVVINTAAYTAVDRAESEAQLAMAINALGPHFLAETVRNIASARLIHVSTDYVFDGLRSEPHKPSDATHPMSVYGRTKLSGEVEILELLPKRSVVLRSAWIYGPDGKNFLLTMLRLMRERGTVRVVTDQRGTPTAASSVARALWRAVELPTLRGVLHWTDGGTASWYEFACAIAEDALEIGLLKKPVKVT